MALTPTSDLNTREATAYANTTTISTGTKRIILTNGGSFTKTSTILDFIVAELLQQYGYTRQTYAPTVGTYDAGNYRQPLNAVDLSYPASGGDIVYTGLAILSNGSATANRSVSSADATANKLNFDLATAHGLAANDKVVVTARSGGTVPAELLNSGNPQILYVKSPVDTGSERSIQLSLTPGGAAIDFSAATLPIDVRYANGNIDYWEPFDGSTVTIAANDIRTIRVRLNFGNGDSYVNS